MTATLLNGKRVVVGGLGRSGRAACRLAIRHGASQVIALDQRPPEDVPSGLDAVFRDPPAGLFDAADLFVVSPGVPANHPWVCAALDSGVPVLGELALAASYVSCPILAVTGTNGKSTVTTLTAQIAAGTGMRVFEGGNLGVPLSEAVLQRGAWDLVVVEVSSYQLEWPGTFRPHAGVVLNVTPDHLARHGDMATYAATKMRLFEHMPESGHALLPYGDSRLEEAYNGRAPVSWIGKAPGVVCEGQQANLSWHGRGHITISLEALPLQGEHNRWNMAVALWLVGGLGLSQQALQNQIPHVTGLPHRMESLGEVDGVLWINDSKATNVEAAEVAIRGVSRRCVVLLGGEAKGPGYDRLRPYLGRHGAVVAFGSSRGLIESELQGLGIPLHVETTLEAAVYRALNIARPGEGILLSPGGASFDAFRNFEHRGEVFRALSEACKA